MGMKPRQESATLTDEDICIFAKGYRGCPILPGTPITTPFWSGLLWGTASACDQRDADLMLQLTKMRNSLRSLKRTTDRMIEGLTETEKRVLRERFGRDV